MPGSAICLHNFHSCPAEQAKKHARRRSSQPLPPVREGADTAVTPEQLPGMGGAERHWRVRVLQPLPPSLPLPLLDWLPCFHQASTSHLATSCFACPASASALPCHCHPPTAAVQELLGAVSEVVETLRAGQAEDPAVGPSWAAPPPRLPLLLSAAC